MTDYQIEIDVKNLKCIHGLHLCHKTNTIEHLDSSGVNFGWYNINNKGGYIYYIFKFIEAGSIIRRKQPIPKSTYLENIHLIHNGEFKYQETDIDDTEIILCYSVSQYTRLIKRNIWYDATTFVVIP